MKKMKFQISLNAFIFKMLVHEITLFEIYIQKTKIIIFLKCVSLEKL